MKKISRFLPNYTGNAWKELYFFLYARLEYKRSKRRLQDKLESLLDEMSGSPEVPSWYGDIFHFARKYFQNKSSVDLNSLSELRKNIQLEEEHTTEDLEMMEAALAILEDIQLLEKK